MLLLDVDSASCACTNHALEELHKSIAVGPDPLRPHENIWIRDLIEEFVLSLERLSASAEDALLAALEAPGGAVMVKAGPWSQAHVLAVTERLSKPLGEYTASDWLVLVDLVLQTHIPGSELDGLVDRFAWSSFLAGRLAGERMASPRVGAEVALLSLLTRLRRGRMPAVLRAERTAIGYARARIGLYIQGVTDEMRRRLSLSILRHIESSGLARSGLLVERLRDEFGELNRDWRRIAITEAGETANLGYLAAFPHGTKVRRVEAYDGACPFCREINGRVFEWVDAATPDKDGERQVWPGKTNYGRSASPMKRTPLGLTHREPEEMWWVAAGVQHPNCRGRWVPVEDRSAPAPRGVDPEFASWLQRELAHKVPIPGGGGRGVVTTE